MKHWKFLVPAVIVVMTMGAGCSGTGGSSTDASASSQGQVDTAVNAIVDTSANEDAVAASEEANATVVSDTESINNLGYTYDTNNF